MRFRRSRLPPGRRLRSGSEDRDLGLELGHLADQHLALRQELVQRRVERADRHAVAVHDLEQPAEVRALERQQRRQRALVALAGGHQLLVQPLRLLRAGGVLAALAGALELAARRLVRALERTGLAGGEDHVDHDRQALLGEEHVLGAAQADALGAELARLFTPSARRVRRTLSRRAASAHDKARNSGVSAVERLTAP